MDNYRKDSTLSYYSEDDSEEEGSGAQYKRKKDGEDDQGSNKKRKVEAIGSMPRFSNASTISSFGSASGSSSEGEESPVCFSGKESSMGMQQIQQDGHSDDMSPQSGFSNISQKMMMNMGYQKGKGLGRFQQGIVAPISASRQRGRRGLGFTIEGLEPMENLSWDKSQEHVSVKEEVFWLPLDTSAPPDLQTLLSWAKEGPKLKDISDQTEFCHPKILQQILISKTVFDNLSEKELFKARTRSNPFEMIGKLFFQNRAALKMANLDAVFDFMLTRPKDETGRSLVGPEELLYFADVCAAPGGFSEYVLWKRKTMSNGFCDAKGFGFTLRENDFKLHDFFAAPSEFFEPHYGVNGNHGDGDIYVPTNISNFRNFVLKSTGGKGVHFMMADGGFSVDGQENIQEILSKQLYLCQFLVALGIIRADGHFVCKLFDIFTPFSVGLIYIMYKSFKQISIHKPNTSRPANSERYLICKWRKENVEDPYEYLYKINARLRDVSTTSDHDVAELVPLHLLKEDKEFFQYIYDSNVVFGERQVIGLQKIRAFCQDLSLYEDQQANLRKESIAFWELPDRSRVAPGRMDPKSKVAELLHPHVLASMNQCPEDLCLENLGEKVRSPYDFRFVFLASLMEEKKRERGFFLGLGGPNVYICSGKDSAGWQRVDALLNLPRDTLIYGELVMELRGELKAQRKVRALHCIDALLLNGFDVTNLHLVERHNYLRKFATAVNKESRNDLVTLRCKPIFKLEEMESVIREPTFALRVMKGSHGMHRRVYREAEPVEDDPVRYTIPTGVMMLKITQDPWTMAYSKSQKRKYWFNTQNRESTFECMKEVIAPLSSSYSQGSFWWWHSGVQILECENAVEDNLHLRTLLDHINRSK